MEGEAIKDKMLRCKTWPFPHSSTQCFKFSRKNLIFNLASNLFSDPLLFLQISYTNLVPSARPAGEDVSSLRYSHFFSKLRAREFPKVFYTFHFKGAVKTSHFIYFCGFPSWEHVRTHTRFSLASISLYFVIFFIQSDE